jgi:predicted  nucleic acid-binding Zn-ribbon protein
LPDANLFFSRRLAKIFTLEILRLGVRIGSSMHDEPPKDLATRAFQKRVLDEFAAIRTEIAEVRAEQTAVRSDIAEIRVQQSTMVQNLAVLEERLTTLEQNVDVRFKETRPIWEGVQEQLQRIAERLEGVLVEFYESRHEMRIHGRRIGQLERRVN